MTIPVETDDLWSMYLCMVRYALGRSSHVTSECALFYSRYKRAFDSRQRDQIAREIEEAIARANAREGTLGMKVDHDGWVTLAEQIREEIGRK